MKIIMFEKALKLRARLSIKQCVEIDALPMDDHKLIISHRKKLGNVSQHSLGSLNTLSLLLIGFLS